MKQQLTATHVVSTGDTTHNAVTLQDNYTLSMSINDWIVIKCTEGAGAQ